MNDTTTTTRPQSDEPRRGLDGHISIKGIVALIDGRPGAHVFLVAPRLSVARRMFAEVASSPEVLAAALVREARVERTLGREVIVWPNGARLRAVSSSDRSFGIDPVHVAIVSDGKGGDDDGWNRYARRELWAQLERTDGEVYELDHTVLPEPKPTRRTIRLYASQLYPHADEGQRRPLDVEVPYLYAHALGLDHHGTGAMNAEPTVWMDRLTDQYSAARLALLADALHQDLVGQEAWDWMAARMHDEFMHTVYVRAQRYGVDPDRIKPYPCGPDPDHHDHYEPSPTHQDWQTVIRAEGREEDCLECTEPIPEATALSPDEWAAVEHFGFDRPETNTEREENDHA